MEKIKKFLKKLNEKERHQIEKVLAALFYGKTEALNIKKLKGRDDVFRVRAGNFRIIFQRKNGEDIRILDIGRRDEDTYKNV